MKLMHVYIVKCSDKSYYTGVTNDIERRLVEHNSVENPNSYTYKRRPVELVYCEDFGDPMSAFEFEKQVKGWTRKKKEALIEENWENLSELAKCKNLTSHKNFNKNDQSQKSS